MARGSEDWTDSRRPLERDEAADGSGTLTASSLNATYHSTGCSWLSLLASSDREVCFKKGDTERDIASNWTNQAGETLPSILKTNMAPKTTWNSGDKEGTKTTRAGKDKGDPAGAVRCPVTTTVKLIGKNTTGVGRDAKNDDVTIPPLATRGKDKIQPTITSFLAVGAQESFAEHIVPSLANSQPAIEAMPPGNSNEREMGALNEINESLIKGSQGDDGLSGVLASSVATKKKGGGLPVSRNGHQAQRSKIPAGREAAGDMDDTTAALSTEVLQHESSKPTVGDKEIEKSLKPPDWATAGGNTYDSFREESDFTSSELNLSASGSSISSETGNISSSNEPTVRQQRQHLKCTKVRSGPSEGTKLSTFSGSKTLKWDYSEERKAAVEADVEALREQCVTQDGQLTDIMWKLEDHENRQRRNNLRFLGINVGVGGNDIRAYMIKLLRGAFPELGNWD
ncbi:hypothetical protein NDU88_000171 [Pleurodeles waltl]|uniref:Uncharacterized protein n=1 Tax=Pleurodeles waltl TaxID=8319 RepID=A0AAV7S3T2_PLEWA|nr:hypothetical protein NDU88_000171 [Pleurodeles waltl]